MSAKSGRAARMARANAGARVAVGFPIVDEATLRLRLAEYAQAKRRVEQAQAELEKLRVHIVKRAFALTMRGGVGVGILPVEWVAQAMAAMGWEPPAAESAVRALFGDSGGPPWTHSMPDAELPPRPYSMGGEE